MTILELPAHTLNWLQPCDRTVFGPLKTFFNQECDQLMHQYTGIMVSKSNICGLFKKVWTKAVSQRNIVAGFKACGIIPYSPETIPCTRSLYA